MTTDYVHLHVHTDYSLNESIAKIGPLVKKARQLEMKALAVTDSGNMYGAMEFYDVCRSQRREFEGLAPIKPIIGCELSVTDNSREQPYKICLLAKNKAGYLNLVKLVSAANSHGFNSPAPITFDHIRDHYEGLHCLLCECGFLKVLGIAKQYQNVFGNDFSIEVCGHTSNATSVHTEKIVALGRELGIRVVAANNVRFVDEGDAEALGVAKAIGSKQILSDPKLARKNGEDWLKSADEMADVFTDYPELLSNTVEIADMVENFDLDETPTLPVFGQSPEADFSELRIKVYEGARKRWCDSPSQEVLERLDCELNEIHGRGFCGYFLIVADFVLAAKAMGAQIGPGRGSAPGSAVLYALGVTAIDPIGNGLLFERFMPQNRSMIPDVDLDFDEDGRRKVIDYLIEKYGSDHVANIVTFGKITPDENNTLRIAEKIEGCATSPGMHACGIVLGQKPLDTILPVMASGVGECGLCTQYDGHYVERTGLVRFDLLGLDALSRTRKCREFVCDRNGIDLDFYKLPLDDKATLDLFARRDTDGIFQFESAGIRQYLKAINSIRFLDLVALNAMFRPGPIYFIPEYIARRNGEKPVEYAHPLLERYLGETCGITVFQEQIMSISKYVAGFSPADADQMRKAVSKLKSAVFEELKHRFIAGCVANPEFRIEKFAEEATARHCAEAILDDWWENGRYAYMKSHAICYAHIAYQCAYIKVHVKYT